MSLFDTFLAQTQLELIFARRLMADIESGALAPTWGMTREQAIAFLADGVAERAEMIERLTPLASPALKTGGKDARELKRERRNALQSPGYSLMAGDALAPPP